MNLELLRTLGSTIIYIDDEEESWIEDEEDE